MLKKWMTLKEGMWIKRNQKKMGSPGKILGCFPEE